MCLSVLLLFLWGTLLTSCSNSPNYAPVVDRSGISQSPTGTYSVRSGDTLYSIAWRYGLDFRKLAYANNLGPPYAIYPGQTLQLQQRPATAARAPAAASAGKTSAPAQTRSRSRSSGTGTAEPARSERRAADRDATEPQRLGAWRWPADGPVGRAFSASEPVHKGIDLQGELGQPVIAANSGQVVYAGSGLVGYGNLIIIKHDGQFLSAYGHNRSILVSEGKRVKAGEKIAEIGDTGTNSVKLHFEIRRSGEPIDPLRILPKR